MTGDGVNDAPSLKKADTGIAVEGASDAARSAADIVFLAPGLSAIIDALKVCKSNYESFRDKLTNIFLLDFSSDFPSHVRIRRVQNCVVSSLGVLLGPVDRKLAHRVYA